MMEKIFIRTLEMQKESLALSQNNIEHDINHCYEKIRLLVNQKKKVTEHIADVNEQIKNALLNG
jgi:phosphotransferase system IIB component